MDLKQIQRQPNALSVLVFLWDLLTERKIQNNTRMIF